jgi:dipeptidyl aminopeptidase/acylaminoacyl peptidase
MRILNIAAVFKIHTMKKGLLTISFLFCLTAGFSQGKMTPEFLWKLGRVSEPQLSRDGKECVYNVRTISLELNKGNSDVWKVDMRTGSAMQLTNDSANETSAKWSADGKKIFYLSDKGGASQLWSMNADGSSQQKESSLDYDINGFGISPDGGMIWLAADVKIDKSVKDLHPDLPKTTGRIYDELSYRHWDTWANGSYSHIMVAKFDNGKISGVPNDLMRGERYDAPMKPHGGEEQVAWSYDGKWLAYTCKKSAGKEYAVGTNSDIYLYDVAKDITSNLTEGMPGYDKDPVFSPDGKKLIWKSMQEEGFEADRERLFLYNFAAKEKKELTAGFDYNVNMAAFNAGSSMIYMLAGIKATENLFSYDLSGKSNKPMKQVTSDAADHTALTVASDGKNDVVVTSRMSISEPTELFSIDLKTGTSKQITFTNKTLLGTIKLARVEKRMIRTTDAKDMLTWIIYPPDFDPKKKYPTLLYCQGGPQSTVSQFFSYRWNFQLMAAHGYIVVAPNRRGLPSFGEEWNDEISRDWAGQCMDDYLSAIDSMSKEPFVNKDKLGAVGASFGGYSVFWLAGHHKKRFKAFIAHDGTFNLESMYGGTEELWFTNHEFGGPYWSGSPDYKKFSPHNFVKNWDTPILIITNEKDYRVPYEQGLEAYTAARMMNVPARLLTFPDENHWVLKAQNSVLWQRTFFDWLDRYLKN